MEITLSDLRRNAETSPQKKLSLQLLLWDFDRPVYAAWVSLIHEAMEYAISEMVSRRNDLHDLDEDAITAFILAILRALNLNASAQVINGNTDLSISFYDYRWLGEAKIATDLSKIYHGYQQLVSRYSTGLPNQSHGGMLLYCTHEPALHILEGWRAALLTQHPDCGADDRDTPLTFNSVAVCPSTGLDLRIRHFAIGLYHKPMEDTLKLSKESIHAGRAARRDARRTT